MPVMWPVAILLAIPITHTALASANVDLWTNALFCIFLLAGWQVMRFPAQNWRMHALIRVAALVAAALSKL